MRNLAAAIGVALCLAACSGPAEQNQEFAAEADVVAADADSPAHFADETQEDLELQEAIRRVEAMPASPLPEPQPPSDHRWFILAPRQAECVLLDQVMGVSEPDQVAALFSANGQPQELVDHKEGYVRMRDAGNPADPGMAFVQGEAPCWYSLRTLQASG